MFLEKEIEFILALDALKNINRRNYNLDDARRENSAEHSWQVMVFAQVLYPHALQRDQISLEKVLKMLSIHDVVEIDAGDTFFFDEQGYEDKYERELASAKRLFGILPEPIRKELLELWLEFEACETVDAVFANAVDRLIPVVLNCHNQGTSWTEAGISLKQVVEKIRPCLAEASPAMAKSFDVIIEKAFGEGKLVMVD